MTRFLFYLFIYLFIYFFFIYLFFLKFFAYIFVDKKVASVFPSEFVTKHILFGILSLKDPLLARRPFFVIIA